MKHDKVKPAKEIIDLNQPVSDPSLEELQRSHHLLEALVAVLPSHTKKELVDLLHTLAQSDGSQKPISVHQRALEIVSDICKPNPPQQGETPEYKQDGERRQGDRRLK